MRQAHLYFSGATIHDPAVIREVTELFMMEEFHWLPKDIAEIPYKKLQILFVLRKQRGEAKQVRANIEKFKSNTRGSGSKRQIIEV